MKEYSIFIRNKKGRPYFLTSSYSLDTIKSRLHEITSYNDIRDVSYFVDNDYFSNSFQQGFADIYYCIKVREVSEWQNYSSQNSNSNDKSNIINFYNYFR